MHALRRLVWVITLFLPVSLGSTNSLASEPWFDGAEGSVVNYSHKPHAATRSCPDIATLAANGVTLQPRSVPATEKVPEYCELVANIPAETGVHIALPVKWNGRIWMIGNGGFAGGHVGPGKAGAKDHTIAYRLAATASGLRHGFMTVYTNGGHYKGAPFDGSFAHQRPDLLEDLAHRAIHEGVQLAKQAAKFYYGMEARYSYFEGCSTGGRQGLMAAYRYPDDFDGIVSNAPVVRWSDLMVKARWNHIALASAPGLTQQKMSFAFKAVLEKCDAIDGLRDGLISDPRQCDFDPVRDLPSCEGATDEYCFTAAEKKALAAIRQGPPLRGDTPLPQYWDTLDSATTARWLANLDGSPPLLSVMAQSFFKYTAFFPEQNPDYDWQDFDFDRDPQRMKTFDEMMNPPPEFDGFRKRGGKIMGVWGWSDASVNPAMGMSFYQSLIDDLGIDNARDFYRLFFVPGVGNCSGGYGPGEIDVMTPLIEWVEAAQVPDRLPARKTVDGEPVYNRAYCPFPQATVYQGGDPERPGNWVCDGN